MVDIRFEQDVLPQKNFRNTNSKLTQLFIDKSFGLVKTPQQAIVAQIIVAVILFIFSATMFATSVPAAPPSAPSQELIDAPQPTRPLVQ
jgi:uncharacterized membrane protein